MLVFAHSLNVFTCSKSRGEAHACNQGSISRSREGIAFPLLSLDCARCGVSRKGYFSPHAGYVPSAGQVANTNNCLRLVRAAIKPRCSRSSMTRIVPTIEWARPALGSTCCCHSHRAWDLEKSTRCSSLHSRRNLLQIAYEACNAQYNALVLHSILALKLVQVQHGCRCSPAFRSGSWQA